MAEFCLDCWNRISKMNLTERDVILSKELDLCEGCEKYKPVIEIYRKNKFSYDFRQWIYKKVKK